MSVYGQPLIMGQPPSGVPMAVPPNPGSLRPDDPTGEASYRRNEAIGRMVAFNHRHASRAWDHRRSQPACPHGVAFLYREPGIGGSPFEQIRAATAIFDADDDSTDLARLLYRLIGVAGDHRAKGRLDPAAQMAIHRDEPTKPAELFGIAVSTLDTPTATWAEQQRQAKDENDIAGRCLILLAEKPPTNHGFIVVERGAPRLARYDLGIRSTVDLSYQLGISTREWQQVSSMPELLVEDEVWQLMYRLHLLAFDQNPRPTL